MDNLSCLEFLSLFEIIIYWIVICLEISYFMIPVLDIQIRSEPDQLLSHIRLFATP